MLTLGGPKFSGSESKSKGDETPLQVVGTVLSGLGAATLFASGITWLIGATHAARLESECPGGLCVEGTSGGSAYVTARDSLRAADIVAGVGFPVLGAGLVLIVFSASIGKRRFVMQNLPVVTAGPSGGSLAVHF
jgi:hypothetical protein